MISAFLAFFSSLHFSFSFFVQHSRPLLLSSGSIGCLARSSCCFHYIAVLEKNFIFGRDWIQGRLGSSCLILLLIRAEITLRLAQTLFASLSLADFEEGRQHLHFR
jgi:NO-binding membrane sensor protein with MHYT domain